MLIALNKPFNVLSQFSEHENKTTLAVFGLPKNVYAAGRLDYDSEGLLLLTDDGKLQHEITSGKYAKTYWVQVEGLITDAALAQLCRGVTLNDGPTKPAKAVHLNPPAVWERTPPVRFRQSIPTSWLALTITEGRNRQVRRMTAHVGFPTLRLIRASIGPYTLEGLAPGAWRRV